jgi:superfamily II DNA or RNA helicase
MSEKAFKLRPHQEQAVFAAEEAFAKGQSALLDMATGSGKTIIFAELLKRFHQKTGKRGLVLAHTEELISQAISKIRLQSGKYPTREQAASKGDKTVDFVVGSVQSMQKARLARWEKNHFGMLVVDEAHHSVAPTYRNVIDHFEYQNLLGVSATIDRHDRQALGDIFDTVAFRYPLHKAIRDGNLVPIVGRRVTDFDIDLTGLKVVRGDYQDSDLGEILKVYFAPIANAIKAQSEDKKTLVFMPNVESSRLMAEELKTRGVKAEFLAGIHDKNERRKILHDFHVGNISHLCACNILLEGFDEPAVEALVMLRPTPSRPLFAQAVGRGTRLSPATGKKEVTLIEFTFNSQRLSLASTYDLFSAAGYEERVRGLAKEMAGEEVDYLDLLDKAKQKYYSADYVLERLITQEYGFIQFDPLTAGELVGQDLTGEFDIHYEGRKLEGKSTRKQIELLSRYGIAKPETLDKAQASVLIGELMERWPAYSGPATDRQAYKLRQLGYNPQGVMKAQASMLIDQALKARDEQDDRKNFTLDF